MNANFCSRGITTDYIKNGRNNETVKLGPRNQQSTKNYKERYLNTPYIVYRSAKYDGPHARASQIFQGYVKYYVLYPLVEIANRCKNVFYQICGLLLLLVTSPLWMLMVLGLVIARKLRLILIKRLYPQLVVLNDDNRFSFSQETHGIINFVIWTKGTIDASALRKKFKMMLGENPRILELLNMKRTYKLSLPVWELCSDLKLEYHIVNSPIHNCPIVDESLKALYRTGANNKCVLQKLVSYCVSSPLDCAIPPWKIYTIPYISRDEGVKEKTCLVIRMHVTLINNRELQQILRELFLIPSSNFESIVESEQKEEKKEVHLCDGQYHRKLSVEIKTNDNGQTTWRKCVNGWKEIPETWIIFQNWIKMWMNLRFKQLEYHSKTAVLLLVLVDAKKAVKQALGNLETFMSELWIVMLKITVSLLTTLQAVSSVPIIILVSLVRRIPINKLGLQHNTKMDSNKRLISWSDLIHMDLAEEICRVTGTSSPENVILMTCIQALTEYFQQNGISNPKTLGYMLGSTSAALTTQNALKFIHLPCNANLNYATVFEEIQLLEQRIQKFPEWKLLGLSLVLRYSPYIFPRVISRELQKSLVLSYPFSFTYVNLRSETFHCGKTIMPVSPLYGEALEDVAFWVLPPLSAYGISISLVHHNERTRLFVMSPYLPMDTVLTNRCNHYLIKLAEIVGVDRTKIPYSRRSSPSSTSCSTPLPTCVNHVEKL